MDDSITEKTPDAEVVWEATMDDGVYTARVTRVPGHAYSGVLTLWTTATAHEWLNTPVTLSYGAKFGPDAADIHEWMNMCEEAAPPLEE